MQFKLRHSPWLDQLLGQIVEAAQREGAVDAVRAARELREVVDPRKETRAVRSVTEQAEELAERYANVIEDEHDRLEKMRKEASSVLMLEYGNMSKQTNDCLLQID